MAGALGKALIDFWGGGAKKSYRAVGYRAQILQLVSVKEGSAAADKAGLHVKQRRTIENWISGKTVPSARDQRKIAQAYHILAGRWNPADGARRYGITGLIDSGDRLEQRTLNIGQGDYESSSWTRIAAVYDAGDPDPMVIEQLFIEDVIVPDIGESSPRPDQMFSSEEDWEGEYGWSFPGQYYTIT